MNIKTIEEAKQYIGKIVYTASDFGLDEKYVVQKLYIGGIHLFYNQVDYVVIGFELYENEKCTKSWGEVKKDKIVNTFDASISWVDAYFFSKNEADKYLEWLQRDSDKKREEYDVKCAKELLEKHKIKYEIFN